MSASICWAPMNVEKNRLLFSEKPVEVKDFTQVTDHFIGVYGNDALPAHEWQKTERWQPCNWKDSKTSPDIWNWSFFTQLAWVPAPRAVLFAKSRDPHGCTVHRYKICLGVRILCVIKRSCYPPEFYARGMHCVENHVGENVGWIYDNKGTSHEQGMQGVSTPIRNSASSLIAMGKQVLTPRQGRIWETRNKSPLGG